MSSEPENASKKTEPCKDADDKINHSKINYLFPLNITISCITEFQNIHSLQMPASHNDQQELISRLMVQKVRTCNLHMHVAKILKDGCEE